MAVQQRPLSPHLQVYKPQLTSAMSIVHRSTGVLLGMGAFILATWLISIAGDGDAFAQFNACAGTVPGRLLLIAIAGSLAYHLLNGIRHLLWDIGWGFELRQAYASGLVVLGLAVAITGIVVYLGLQAGGAA